ncbi:cyclophilin-like domain-containing protein [Scheffersomyces xylosifermentans]|uniref:cyclophilin-like domain-containing protein n=1 Tax=Scheffersomyces xylosifermentans TaxID=1304137 RepID=UPI00315CE644
MSTLEPQTTAKVVVNTSKGPIELELWAKELPLVSRAFLQRCLDNGFTGQKFTTLLDQLIQVEVPQGATFDLRDEFHSRIRFNRKGLLGAIKKDEDLKNNHSVDSFFISLQELPQYNSKFIIFGKLVGESIYNVIKIKDSELDKDGIPIYPAIIQNVEVVVPYFDDLVPTTQEEQIEEPEKKKPKKSNNKGIVKLSYDDEEPDIDVERDDFKMKSAHELLRDKKLSKRIVEVKSSKVEEYEEEEEVDNTQAQEEVEEEVQEEVAQEESTQKKRAEDVEENDNESESQDSNEESDSTPVSPKVHPKDRKRDPEIDSDYNSNLDLSSDDDEYDLSTLQNHKFTAK